VPPVDVVPKLLNLFPNQTWYIVAREKHQDGQFHLHVAVELAAEFTSNDAAFADVLCGQHGNYQAMKNMRKCVEYVTKDGDYIAQGIDVASVLKKKGKSSKFLEATKLISAGKELKDLDAWDPGFVMQHKRKIEEYSVWKKSWKVLESRLPWPPTVTVESGSVEEQIVDWLMTNIQKERVLRQPQLYLHGKPGVGKTTMVMNLEKYLKIYYIPKDEDFYNLWEDQKYDLAVLDEFRGQKTIQWMNAWLDGQPNCLRVKGSQVMKMQKIPTIILSNYWLPDVYTKVPADKLESLISRVKEVYVDKQIEIKFE